MTLLDQTKSISKSLFPLLILLPVSCFGQSADTLTSKGIFDLLAAHKVAEISLTTNMTEVLTNKRLAEYLDGEFTFPLSDAGDLTLPVRIRIRGRFRRMKCQFPPLKLKFRKDDLAPHGLNEFNELKLVTHCLDDRETSSELVCREYLAYRLFNIVGPQSFRAQVAQVTYLNTNGKPKKTKGWGILIEDADELAHRMNALKIDSMAMPDSCFHPEQEAVTALFQFMIGNTDWSCRLNRNIQQLWMPDSTVHVVPYDFDFSGLVAAPYARPKREIGQQTVRHRIFLGKATSLDELRPTIQHFLAKKEAILTEVKEFDLLGNEARQDVLSYLGEFFETIEDEEKAQAALFPTSENEAAKQD